MKIKYSLFMCLIGLAASGCVNQLRYIEPDPSLVVQKNSRKLPMSRDEVWAKSVPKLGKKFFVINNIDRASGLINLSYSGDPERFLNCGIISAQKPYSSEVFSFPASRGAQQYSALNPLGVLVSIDRKMALEGRVNLVFEEDGPNGTLVTASAKYVLTKTVRFPNTKEVLTDTISFNSGESAAFPGADQQTRCYATGALGTNAACLSRSTFTAVCAIPSG